MPAGALQTNLKATAATPSAVLGRGLLQRKCACGGTPGPDGECASCRKKRLALQRRAVAPGGPATAPPIVHQVLGAPGRPLDSGTRAMMEPRLGHDFSRVRVHTDAQAAESARAVGALAYTVGRDIVFGAGQYAPGSTAGSRLLAHELVHTVQQRASNPVSGEIRIGDRADAYEQAADRAVEQRLARRLDEGVPLSAAPIDSLRLQRSCSQHSDEQFYKTAPNYCKDTGFSGSLHPGQRCYREVPVRASYWDCPPGDQVCFDEDGNCEDSFDKVSTVESKDSDGSCNLHGYCFLGHAKQDIVPGAPGIKQTLCISRCISMSGMAKFFCLQHCMR